MLMPSFEHEITRYDDATTRNRRNYNARDYDPNISIDIDGDDAIQWNAFPIAAYLVANSEVAALISNLWRITERPRRSYHANL